MKNTKKTALKIRFEYHKIRREITVDSADYYFALNQLMLDRTGILFWDYPA